MRESDNFSMPIISASPWKKHPLARKRKLVRTCVSTLNAWFLHVGCCKSLFTRLQINAIELWRKEYLSEYIQKLRRSVPVGAWSSCYSSQLPWSINQSIYFDKLPQGVTCLGLKWTKQNYNLQTKLANIIYIIFISKQTGEYIAITPNSPSTC